MQTHQIYINGKFTDSTSNDTIDIINPATEEVISKIKDGTEEDVNKAVVAAKQAQISWEQKPAIERGKTVRKLGEKIEANREEFIDLLQEEQGKDYDLAVVKSI